MKKKVLEVRGKCTDPEKAVEFFEMLVDSIPDEEKEEEFCDEYEAALNTFRYAARRLVKICPKRHKGKYVSDYYTCSECGQDVNIKDNFCRNCGRPIKWDNPRCLTDYKEREVNAVNE